MEIRLIDRSLVTRISQEAQGSPRRRALHRFHRYEEPIQRMVNVLLQGSYVCPHRHKEPDKTEIFILLQGKGVVLTFDEEGKISSHCLLDGDCWGAEIPPGTWHMVAALSPEAAFYEIIEGPYDPQTHKRFAPWAPPEGDPAGPAYLSSLLSQIST
ncbi:MAG TPA: cupin fold metalloprotein, WbuC family [Cyanobacteria bacterium UBA8530]|nr:cupin fold metalloprotein, WbuC family [Cyanobacteria bacterium UBA8530]